MQREAVREWQFSRSFLKKTFRKVGGRALYGSDSFHVTAVLLQHRSCNKTSACACPSKMTLFVQPTRAELVALFHFRNRCFYLGDRRWRGRQKEECGYSEACGLDSNTNAPGACSPIWVSSMR